MELIQGLLMISAIHLMAAASPGPDFVLVSQQTLSNGRRAGLLCSLGIALGLSVHIIYSILGLAVVIANSSSILLVIKVLGGGYLIYLGIKGLLAKPQGAQATVTAPIKDRSAAKTVGMGFLCNVLNPKAPIYFVALFTVVLSPEIPLYQLAIYGAWMMVIQLGWFATVVTLLSRPVIRSRFNRIQHWIDRGMGGTMVLMGLKVVATQANKT